MTNAQTLNRNLEAMTWGALFIWWGITELAAVYPMAPARSASV